MFFIVLVALAALFGAALSAKRGPWMIYCCKCGALTRPRLLNMCDICAATEVDLAVNVKKQDVVEYCRKCERYLSPPRTWTRFARGSSDFLFFLLKKNRSLARLNIKEAAFEFTEEHSRRLLIRILVEEGGFEQALQLTVLVKRKQCPDCEKIEAKQYWQSKVQVRQRVKHKRTFMYLEQVMLKHGAHRDATNIEEVGDGLDFSFQTKNDAQKFVSFLQSVIGTRVKTSSKLMRQDVKSNISFFRNSFSVEIFPLCKDDLVYLHGDFASRLSIGSIVVVLKVTTVVTVIDPVTLRVADLNNKCYWANAEKIHVLASSPQLREYMVLEVREDGVRANKHLLADVFVSRDGTSTVHCKTHLGDVLSEGELVQGYDVSTLNTPLNIAYSHDFNIFLVRKKIVRPRHLKIKTKQAKDEEYNMFVDDLVRDEELLRNVNIYDEENNLIANLRDLSL